MNAVLKTDPSVTEFARGIPKAELHIHIEGSLEPELIFALAQRNGMKLAYPSVDALRAAYAFTNLQSFLDIYYAGASVLLQEADFHDMAWAYFERAKADNIVHAELFFDPQTHTARGVPIGAVIDGLDRACRRAQAELGIRARLILCFLRHLDEDAAFATLREAEPFREQIAAVGLDSSEVGHPPEKFARVFAEARAQGYLAVAHAGEEGPPEYIWQALDALKVRRIDHGVRCLEDPRLVDRLVAERIPLTVCPLSNVKLRVFPAMRAHNLRRLIEAGLLVTINSDDPAYFGGYIGENYLSPAEALGLDREHVAALARGSIEASFLEEKAKAELLAEVDAAVAAHMG